MSLYLFDCPDIQIFAFNKYWNAYRLFLSIKRLASLCISMVSSSRIFNIVFGKVRFQMKLFSISQSDSLKKSTRHDKILALVARLAEYFRYIEECCVCYVLLLYSSTYLPLATSYGDKGNSALKTL